MKNLITIFALLGACFPGAVSAQSPSFDWAKGGGSSGNDYGYAIAVDSTGFSYVTGFFEGPSLHVDTTTLVNNGNSAFFVAKYDTGGHSVWARTLGGNYADDGNAIAVDAIGNSFITGNFTSASASFDAITLSNVSPGNSDAFLVKCDQNGNVVWVRNQVGAGSEVARRVGVDNLGNIYVAGYFNDPTIIIGSDTLTNSSAGSLDIYLVKYDPSGNVIWARSAGGTGVDYAIAMTLDRLGNVYIAGEFNSSVISFGATSLPNGGAFDMYVVKYSSSGNVVWAKRAGGTNFDFCNGLGVDSIGNCYVSGQFLSSSITFGSTTLTNGNPGSGDIYITKFDPNGVLLWANHAGGAGYDWMTGLATDAAGNSYMIGYFNGPTINFGGKMLSNTHPGNEDVYIVRYDANGNVIDALGVGGVGSDFSWGVAVDRSGSGLFTGSFWSPSISFGSTVVTNVGGNSDMFVAKIMIPPLVAPSITSIKDIPADQGGQLRIIWTKSSLDVTGLPVQVTSYSIWRKSSGGPANRPTNHPIASGVSTDTSIVGFDYVVSVPAVQIPQYQTVVPTLEDSTSSGAHRFTFLVVAHRATFNDYFVSAPDSGCSVDNLAPLPPAGLAATLEAGPQVHLTWDSPTDPDVKSYSIYRSVSPEFISTKIGTSSSTDFTDTDPYAAGPSFYTVVAIDIHDNASQHSTPVSLTPTTTQSISVRNRWNLVSVPLSVGDYSRTALYPTATSNAFAYEGGYLAYATLKSGAGYWLKFDGTQTFPVTGFLRTSDTVDVHPGWNLIGSISIPIAASQLTSIPGGMTISKLFTYSGTYEAADTITPGDGYWVKVNQSGKIILSNSGPAAKAGRVNIVPTLENPPRPPEENESEVEPLPTSYALEQNYPNPFNPSTTIRYSLPMESDVRLSVVNMLGEEVATLVNEHQQAGFRSITFNAEGLSSGMYVYRLTAGSFIQVKKFLLIK